MLVLALAIFLVFTVLLIEFGSFYEPVAIVFGAVLAMFGTVLGLWITGTTLNVVSFLGAIIGVGIVAKNGILMLDFVEHLRAEGAEPRGRPGSLGPSPVAPGPDDLHGRRLRHVAAGLRHRQRRGHAQTPGHRRHRRALHLGPAFAGGHAHGLLPAAAGFRHGKPDKPHSTLARTRAQNLPINQS